MNQPTEVPKEWGTSFTLADKKGRFYKIQRRTLGDMPSVTCVDADGYLVARMFFNTHGGVSFETWTQLSANDTETLFHMLKNEVPESVQAVTGMRYGYKK